jgi:hypothetical protein
MVRKIQQARLRLLRVFAGLFIWFLRLNVLCLLTVWEAWVGRPRWAFFWRHPCLGHQAASMCLGVGFLDGSFQASLLLGFDGLSWLSWLSLIFVQVGLLFLFLKGLLNFGSILSDSLLIVFLIEFFVIFSLGRVSVS